MFVAIDGPNGAGKTRFLTMLETELKNGGVDVFVTKEPSDTKLGNFARSYAETEENREAVAYIVAADRYVHYREQIMNRLESGMTVISDRYLMSSFIMQGLDGVSFDMIELLNGYVAMPDIQVVLCASQSIIEERLKKRDSITRYENMTSNEIEYTEKACAWMEAHGVKVVKIRNDFEEDLQINVKLVIDAIYTCGG